MGGSTRNTAKSIAVGVFLAMALTTCLISPGLAQRDPLDLAQAGFVAKDRRDFVLAVRLFSEALARGQFVDKQRGFLLYGRGVSYEALGIWDRALSDLDAAIALLPEYPNAYLYRGIIWGDMREYDRALRDFITASKLNPADPPVFNNLANAYEQLGDLDRAIENYDRAIKLRPDYAQAYYNRARTYILKQQTDQALADYDQAIALQPIFGEAYVNRAVLRLARHDFIGSLSDLDTAIKLIPQDATAFSNRADAYLALERYPDALSDFNMALKISPGNAGAYLGRGRAYLFSGAIDEGIEDLQTAVRLRPSNPYPVIWLHIARVHNGESDRDELEFNAKEIKRDVWPGAMLDLYLGVLDVDGVKSAAQKGIDRDKSKRECELRFFLGELAVHKGETQLAREALRDVISSCGPAETIYSAALAEAKLVPLQ